MDQGAVIFMFFLQIKLIQQQMIIPFTFTEAINTRRVYFLNIPFPQLEV